MCMFLCEFSDGEEGGKDGKRQVCEKGGMWGPARAGARPAGPQLVRLKPEDKGEVWAGHGRLISSALHPTSK